MIIKTWVHLCGPTAEQLSSKNAKTELRQWNVMLFHDLIGVANDFLCGGVSSKDQ